MEHDPQVPPYNTGDKSSFAHVSARDRWPVILTSAIDDVHRTVIASQDAEKCAEGKSIIESIGKLKYELQHDRALTPLPHDGEPDVEGYNEELAALPSPTWFNVPWLYAECYLYRRLHTNFSLSAHWRQHDVFARQKLSTFKSSRPAVLELAARYKSLIAQLQAGGAGSKSGTDGNNSSGSGSGGSSSSANFKDAERLLFTEMCEICLWGNATDLSLLTSLSYTDIQKLQGASARRAAEANVLVNDLPAAFDVLYRSKMEKARQPDAERRVDFVLDNAGFELFVDLALAGYLLAAGLATRVVLHPKSLPWFVSDVVPGDFGALLNALAEPGAFYGAAEEGGDGGRAGGPETALVPLSEREQEELRFLFEHWTALHADGKLVIRPHRAWTCAGSYWRLPALQPALCEDLRTSELVVYKGDLNYRKLTGDAAWDPTTPFVDAIGPLGRGSGMRTLALRTCKADVVVGLPEGVDERIKETEGGGGDSGAREWAWSGKWAVVQFCDGKV